MKKALLAIFFLGNMGLFSETHGEEKPFQGDEIEKSTGLRQISGDRFILDLKYRTSDNFLGQDIYTSYGINACYVHPALYEKLKKVEDTLRNSKLKLVIYDCFRPLSIQKAMWHIKPDPKYVANPSRGSQHNRGVAIDCALADENGTYLEFPTSFDSFEPKAWQNYTCKTNEKVQCQNRNTLKKIMESIGLSGISSEWWHFQIPNSRHFPVLDFELGR